MNFKFSLHYIEHYYMLSHLRKGLIFFPDFCQLCLEKFRENEEEEEEFYKLAFKVINSNAQTDSHSALFDCRRLSAARILSLQISGLRSTN